MSYRNTWPYNQSVPYNQRPVPNRYRFVYDEGQLGRPRISTRKEYIISKIQQFRVPTGRLRSLTAASVEQLAEILITELAARADIGQYVETINLLPLRLTTKELASVLRRAHAKLVAMVPSHDVIFILTMNDIHHKTMSDTFLKRLAKNEIGAHISQDVDYEDYDELLGLNAINSMELSMIPYWLYSPGDRNWRRNNYRSYSNSPNPSPPGSQRGRQLQQPVAPAPPRRSTRQRSPVQRYRPTLPSNGYLPFRLTDFVEQRVRSKDPEFQHLKRTWERYVPNESSGLDCVGHTLRILQEEGKVPPGTVERYMAFHVEYASYNLRQKDFKPLAKELGINIVLHTDRVGQTKHTFYADDRENAPTIEVASVRNHLFVMERTDYSSFSLADDGPLSNTETRTRIEQRRRNHDTPMRHYWYQPSSGSYRTYNRLPGLTSFSWIRQMIENEQLCEPRSPLEMRDEAATLATRYRIKWDCPGLDSGFSKPIEPVTVETRRHGQNPFLDFIQKAVRNKKLKQGMTSLAPPPSYTRLFGDFETINDKVTNRLLADLLVVINDADDRIHIFRRRYNEQGETTDLPPAQQCINAMYAGEMGKIPRFMFIFHNLGFDINFFIQQVPRLRIDDQLRKSSSKVNSMMTTYIGDEKQMRIYFKDSYSVIPTGLAKFNSFFGFEASEKKGDCPHGYFDQRALRQQWASVEQAAKHAANREDFIESTLPYRHPQDDTMYDHHQHRIDYCVQDVRLLRKGYMQFRQSIAELFLGEELDFCVSAPQIAFNYAYNCNAFEGVCRVSGITREWLNENFVHGGRCMTASFKKWHVYDVTDLDAVGLYTTAMSKVKVPKGPGHHIVFPEDDCPQSFDPDDWQDFFVAIRLTHLGCYYERFPLLRTKAEGYNVENHDVDTVYYVSKTYLKELIKHCQIEYRVLGGLFFDKGIYPEHNNLRDTVIYLADLRKQLKAEGKKSEAIVKLISNSIYGRMLMKAPATTETWLDSIEEDLHDDDDDDDEVMDIHLPPSHPMYANSVPMQEPLFVEQQTTETMPLTADPPPPREATRKRKAHRHASRSISRFVDLEAEAEEEFGSDDDDEADLEAAEDPTMGGFINDDVEESDDDDEEEESLGSLKDFVNDGSTSYRSSSNSSYRLPDEYLTSEPSSSSQDNEDDDDGNSLDDVLSASGEEEPNSPTPPKTSPDSDDDEEDPESGEPASERLRVRSSTMQWYMKSEKFRSYFFRHFHYIKEVTTFGNKCCITRHKNHIGHANFAHLGVNILDESKAIMNEVMCLAELNSIPIFYQDTDSMHLYKKDVPRLARLFEQEYGRQLIGKELGQFHSDFAIPKEYSNEYAEESYFVAPKAYVDKVVASLSNPDLAVSQGLSPTFEQYHVRLKGVPSDSILAYCADNFQTPLDLFARLYRDERVEFDILADQRVSFDFRADFTVESRMEFTRSICFARPRDTELVAT